MILSILAFLPALGCFPNTRKDDADEDSEDHRGEGDDDAGSDTDADTHTDSDGDTDIDIDTATFDSGGDRFSGLIVGVVITTEAPAPPT